MLPETAPTALMSGRPASAGRRPSPPPPSPPRPKSAAFGSSSARPNVGLLTVVPPTELFGVPDTHCDRAATHPYYRRRGIDAAPPRAPEPARAPSPPRSRSPPKAAAFGSSSARPNVARLTVVPPSELFGVPDPYVRPPAAPGAPAFPAHVEAPARPPAKPAAFGSSAARPDVARLTVITPDELFGVPDPHARARERPDERARAAKRPARHREAIRNAPK